MNYTFRNYLITKLEVSSCENTRDLGRDELSSKSLVFNLPIAATVPYVVVTPNHKVIFVASSQL